MELEVSTPIAEPELSALRRALERVDILSGPASESGRAGWHRAALDEAVDNEPATVTDGGYALSPRSTRGATRA